MKKPTLSALSVVSFLIFGSGIMNAGTIVGLGSAANYTVLQYNNTYYSSATGLPQTGGTGTQTLAISGGSTAINGLIGIAQGSSQNLSGTISGTTGYQMYTTDPSGSNSSNITPTQNTATNTVLDHAVADAISAYNADSSLTATQTVNTTVNSAATFTSSGTGASNVIYLNGGINENGSGQITISGDASSKFVFVVGSQFTLTNGLGTTLTGGVTASDILWLYSASTTLAMNGGNTTNNVFDGTVIAPDAQISIHDHQFDGEFISGQSITITSNPDVVAASFQSSTPEPGTLSLLIGAGLLTAGIIGKRSKK